MNCVFVMVFFFFPDLCVHKKSFQFLHWMFWASVVSHCSSEHTTNSSFILLIKSSDRFQLGYKYTE